MTRALESCGNTALTGTAESLDEARVFFQSGRYDHVLLDLHRYRPAEALVFCRVIKKIDSNQRIVLLVGPPSYVTLEWQKALAGVGDPSQHLQPKAKRQAAAASWPQGNKMKIKEHLIRWHAGIAGGGNKPSKPAYSTPQRKWDYHAIRNDCADANDGRACAH